MSKNEPRCLTILRVETITPHMRRIVLTGPELEGFPQIDQCGYIKLFFTHAGEPMTHRPAIAGADAAGDAPRPVLRTYSVRRYEPGSLELTIDVVLHGDHDEAGAVEGPGARWGRSCQPGDRILIRGPGESKAVNPDADWFLLAGDMTALPAIGVNLERMPAHAQGHAVVEVMDEADRQPLAAPPGVVWHWVVNPTPARPDDQLVETVTSLPWRGGRPSIWTACEFDKMRRLRRYFKDTRGVDLDDIYISSYWRIDRSEERHKIDKKNDAMSQQAIG